MEPEATSSRATPYRCSHCGGSLDLRYCHHPLQERGPLMEEQRRPHLGILALSLLVLAGGALLTARDDGVYFLGARLPAACAWRGLAAADCPGCGLTRSVIACCHFQWRQSLAYHPGGGAIVAAAFIQGTYRLGSLLAKGPGPRAPWVPPLTRALLVLVLLLSAARWLLGLLPPTP